MKVGGGDFYLRAYLPTEDIPDFTSTVYMYHGVDDEKAPKDTTELNFHPSVTTIQQCAFKGCESLERVTIPDTVTRIELSAFKDCNCLRFIRWSSNLEDIGDGAFVVKTDPLFSTALSISVTVPLSCSYSDNPSWSVRFPLLIVVVATADSKRLW